ncbi:hypothetical protein EDC36_1266 [Tepidimonas ignava]|uniref:Uncharacterized protein n=1 Tax=Tepidimonas ignava TaxID=114249 RepID=A0A4R3L1T4_9BURK|nr:hypothetical protein [Tepidimonas ignava]TCS93561.1 hypothetical protein EDC36_1266 [Tepidimonas ignava]TSE18196.1 hypothetical protein Tigna_02615 [Tepidimonas ignava]
MPITRLQHGISQAIARHVLTHKTEPSGGWTLDGLIKTVAGGDISEQGMRDRRREARADAEGLAAAGVLLEDDRVRRCSPKPGCDVVGVEQNRDGVQQNRDGVQQNRDACSKTAAAADTYSDTDSGAGP